MSNLFLSVKGFGDMVVLANALQRVRDPKESEVLISGRLHDLARMILPEDVRISVIPNLQGVLPLYNMRADWCSMFKGFSEIRRTVRRRIDAGGELILDLPNIKNTILFSNIDHRYLPKSNNIYTSYALELGYELHENFSQLVQKTKIKTCIIFPFGSTSDRSIPQEILIKLLEVFNKYDVITKIVCHSSDGMRIPGAYKNKLIIFEDSVELSAIIKNSQIVVTVDTFAMHLANHFNIDTFVISNGWKFFIPPKILKLDRLYANKFSDNLIQDLQNVLGKP